MPEVAADIKASISTRLLTNDWLQNQGLSAVALEKAVNNTSLMLAFEVGEAVLFFPGDSQ